ncbi:MAG: hypothetical protein HY368_00670 [Candidatus Aenigmarchaeota archaeon]|nr:hypothetical protein [Candidatus Aenigmarchaeota archaeon]
MDVEKNMRYYPNNIFFLGNFLEKQSFSESRRSFASPKIHFFFPEKKKGRKGQMFVIAGLIILIGLFLLRGVFGIYSTLEEKRFQETMIMDKELRNIQHEYENIVAVSRLQGNANASAISNLMDFSTFLRGEEDAEVFYALISVNNTAFSVTAGNFLNDNINLTVNATTSTPAFAVIGAINDKRNGTASFSADISSGIVNVTLTYERRNQNITETIPIRIAPPARERSVLQLFLDAKLKSKDDFARIKSTFNTTW